MTYRPTGAHAALAALLALSFTTCCDDDCDCPSGSGASGAGGAGGGIPTECVPSADNPYVADSCGLFVSSSRGADNITDGTKADPFASISYAIEEAQRREQSRIYVCGEPFEEAVQLPEGISLYGALSCPAEADWQYSPEDKTALSAEADVIPLRVTDAGESHSVVAGFAVTARPAETAGGSSIAALVDGATVSFEGCELVAQAGADGAAGDTPLGKGAEGVIGLDGKDGCLNADPVISPNPVALSCPNGDSTTGGRGGMGDVIAGGGGIQGTSDPVASGEVSNGGDGQTSSESCDQGGDGADGDPGTPGAGASGIGTVNATGYVGSLGQDGQSHGTPGQGGGGGGGARGAAACNTTTNAGPSGGNGGPGGCGGAPGGGGGAGGSSIALISVSAAVTLSGCSLTAATGGQGGAGGDGQEGGDGRGGGDGGDGNKNNACPGGSGGKGGQGGAGGGGLGGHSLGIAHVGAAPTETEVTIVLGSQGGGGLGGLGNANGGGDDGQAAERLDMTAN